MNPITHSTSTHSTAPQSGEEPKAPRPAPDMVTIDVRDALARVQLLEHALDDLDDLDDEGTRIVRSGMRFVVSDLSTMLAAAPAGSTPCTAAGLASAVSFHEEVRTALSSVTARLSVLQAALFAPGALDGPKRNGCTLLVDEVLEELDEVRGLMRAQRTRLDEILDGIEWPEALSGDAADAVVERLRPELAGNPRLPLSFWRQRVERFIVEALEAEVEGASS